MLSRLRAAFREKETPVAIICLLSVALGFSIASNIYRQAPATATAAPTGKLASDWRTAFEDIAAQLGPSVVMIKSTKNVQIPNMPDFGGFFGPFGGRPPFNSPDDQSPDDQPRTQKESFAGSGVIVRSDGYVLTNSHVVADMDSVTVQLNDGRELTGKVLLDRDTDLALVKIKATGLNGLPDTLEVELTADHRHQPSRVVVVVDGERRLEAERLGLGPQDAHAH